MPNDENNNDDSLDSDIYPPSNEIMDIEGVDGMENETEVKENEGVESKTEGMDSDNEGVEN